MLLRRRLIRSVDQLMLVVLLLVQGVHFAQACVLNADRPKMAFGEADHCKMHNNSGPVSPNACLTQCLQTDQSSATQPVSIPSAVNAVLFILPELPPSHALPIAGLSVDLCEDSTPPPILRFCSLLL